MNQCCPHSDDQHHLVDTCQDVVHYPSEDYPCLCSGYVAAAEGEQCSRCSHARKSHVRARVCRPAGGEVCGCQQRI